MLDASRIYRAFKLTFATSRRFAIAYTPALMRVKFMFTIGSILSINFLKVHSADYDHADTKAPVATFLACPFGRNRELRRGHSCGTATLPR